MNDFVYHLCSVVYYLYSFSVDSILVPFKIVAGDYTASSLSAGCSKTNIWS